MMLSDINVTYGNSNQTHRHTQDNQINQPYSQSYGGDILKDFQINIVETVEPNEIVDYLFQHGLISEDDMERVLLPCYTRRTRCRTLMRILRLKLYLNPHLLPTFLDALDEAYSFLADEIRQRIEWKLVNARTCLTSVVACSNDPLIENRLTFSQQNSCSGEIVPPINGGPGDAFVNRTTSYNNDLFTTYGYNEVTQASVHNSHSGDINHVHNDHMVIVDNNRTSKSNSNATCLNTRTDVIDPSNERSYNEANNTQLILPSDNSNVKQHSSYTVQLSSDSDEDECIKEFYVQLIRTHSSCPTPVYRPRCLPPSCFGKKTREVHLQKLFNDLSDTINRGHFTSFDNEFFNAQTLMTSDAEMACVFLYLNACRHVIQARFRRCRQSIKCGLELAAKTSSPNRVIVELLSVRCFMYLRRSGRPGKLELALTNAMEIIAQDVVTCTGKAAGWIYVDAAKALMPLLRTGTSYDEPSRRLRSIVDRATDYLRVAMQHFEEDNTKDGPFGRNYSAVKLASLQLCCDDSLHLLRQLEPSSEDLATADKLLRLVDGSSAGIAGILHPLYYIASADLKFRTGSLRRATELAQEACDWAEKLHMKEELTYAQLRFNRYSCFLSMEEAQRHDSRMPCSADHPPHQQPMCELNRLLLLKQRSSVDESPDESDAYNVDWLAGKKKVLRKRSSNSVCVDDWRSRAMKRHLACVLLIFTLCIVAFSYHYQPFWFLI